jgi:hypothetical protein
MYIFKLEKTTQVIRNGHADRAGKEIATLWVRRSINMQWADSVFHGLMVCLKDINIR